MASPRQAPLLTADEFMELPDPEDGSKLELVDGQVVVLSPAGGRHGRDVVRVGSYLLRFAGEHELGEIVAETTFRLFPGRHLIRTPDVAFIEAAHVPPEGLPESYIPGPPTLAVEVVSTRDRQREIAGKVRDYLAAGTNRVWIVRPRERTITIVREDGSERVFGSGDTLTSDDAGFAVEGFALPLDDIFA